MTTGEFLIITGLMTFAWYWWGYYLGFQAGKKKK